MSAVASGVLVVLVEHPGAAVEHLALVGELELDVREGPPHRLRVHLAVGLDGDEDGSLRLTVELLDVDADRPVEVEDVGADRLTRGVGEMHSREAEGVAERAVDEEVAEPVAEAVAEGHRLAVEEPFPDAARNAHEVVEHPLLEPARVLHPDHDVRQQVLVDARRREVEGGADLPEVGHHRGRALRAVDAEAGEVGLPVGEDVVADPGHRQVGEDVLVRAEALELGPRPRLPEHVVVGQHHPLGPAGGARGVEDDAGIRPRPLRDFGPEEVGIGLVVPLAVGLDVAEVADEVRIVVPEALRPEVHDGLDAGNLLADLEELVDLLLVLDHREARPAVLDHVGQLVRDRVLIHGNGDPAEGLGGTHRPVQARPVVPDDRELVAAPEAEGGETARERLDLAEGLVPVPRLPDPEFLLTDGGTPREALRVVEEQLRERVQLGRRAAARVFSSWPWARVQPGGA